MQAVRRIDVRSAERGEDMSDFIKREDAIKAIECRFNTDLIDRIDAMLMTSAIAQITKNIANIPSAENKGEWLFKEITDDYHITGLCSVCKERRRIDNFCPNCGARMKGADDEVLRQL